MNVIMILFMESIDPEETTIVFSNSNESQNMKNWFFLLILVCYSPSIFGDTIPKILFAKIFHERPLQPYKWL